MTPPSAPRVLMVAFYYPPDPGGLAHQARLLARELARSGSRVAVVTVRHPLLPAFEEVEGVAVHRLFALISGSRYRRRFFTWLPSLVWFLMAHRSEYDVLHIHQAMYHAAAAVLVGRLLGKVTIVKAAGGGESGNVAVLERWALGHWALRQIAKSDCVISLSEEITEELVRHRIERRRVRFIPNGVELDAPPPAPGLDVAPGPAVLIAGRLSAEKGVDDLLHAWPVVLQRVPEARLLILGDGPQEEELRSLARTLGIASAVSFEGNVASEVVRQYLRRVEVFMLPSRHGEGMSNSLLEGMAAGRACLVSDSPPNAAVIRSDVNGLTFRTGDRVDLAARLIELLSDAGLRARLGAAAREVMEREYSIAATGRRYRALYEELVAAAGR